METLDKKLIVRIGVIIVAVCLVMRGWDAVIAVVGAFLAATAPLLAGMVIAYIVNILMSFLERHVLARSTSPAVVGLRPPLCMAIAFLLIVAFIVATGSLLIPALIESFDMIGRRATDLIGWLQGYAPAKPLLKSIKDVFSVDVFKDLSGSKIPDFLKQGLGGVMAPLGEQLAVVASSISTVFFGLLFSVLLLLDKYHVARQVRRLLATYLGPARYDRLAHVCGVFDRSYHGYIVRQCVEALMLGAVSAVALLLLGFPYALGISGLVVFAGLIPVVGIPTGICVGAFLVVTDMPLRGIVYLLVMFVSQSLVETFIMPHVGDRRILLSPVWVTVAVTLGGGLFGFLGMISMTPLAAALHQLLQEGIAAREGTEKLDSPDSNTSETLVGVDSSA